MWLIVVSLCFFYSSGPYFLLFVVYRGAFVFILAYIILLFCLFALSKSLLLAEKSAIASRTFRAICGRVVDIVPSSTILLSLSLARVSSIFVGICLSFESSDMHTTLLLVYVGFSEASGIF